MKRRNTLILACITGLLFNSSCTKDDSGVEQIDNNRITPVLADNFNLSQFSYAVKRGNMNKKLEEAGPFTVLAPSDAAFMLPEYFGVIDLTATDNTFITSMVRQHIIEGSIEFDKLPYQFNQELSSLEGKLYATHHIRGNDTAITINGARVLRSHIPASNGYVQVINRVLQPAVHALLADALMADENLTLFAHAMKITGLLDTIRTKGPFTIFVPDNTAMKAQGYATIQQVNEADPAALKKLLGYHILRNRRFITDYILSAGANDENVQEMMDGQTVKIMLLPDPSEPGGYAGISLRGPGNTNDLYIQKRDLIAGNGVLHIINGVLLP